MPLRRSHTWLVAAVAALGLAALAVWLRTELRERAARSGPPPIVRGPQVGSVTKTSAVVTWRTDPAVRGGLDVRAVDEDASWVYAAPGALEDHSFTLADLRPGRRYRYRVRCDGTETGPEHEFGTAPEAPARFRFVAVGDGGSGSETQARIAEQMLAAKPSFLIHTGDVVYPHGAERDFDPHHFFPYRALIDHVPFYVCLGNHDVEGERRGLGLLEAMPLPRNDRTRTSEFYSWDWSNGHFAALNTERTFKEGSDQYQWLAEDLAKSDATWKVVYFHKPPFSNSRSTGAPGVRAALCPLFEKHGVTLVLSGHDHQYERTFPMVQAKPVGGEKDPDYVDPAGPVYVVTGGGGKSLYDSGTSEFTAFSRSAYHFVQVDVDGLTLTLTAIGTDDRPFDKVTIRKTR
jgi:hypothetical protein